jgi:hypothetical protein
VLRSRLPHAALLALLGGTACSNDYQAPTADQPHALVEFERDYDRSAGLLLEERLLVLDQPAFEASSEVSSLGRPHVDMLLLHPGPTRIDVVADFVHYEYRTFLETYYVNGRSSYRYVTRRIRILDATCSAREWFSAAEGGRYVLAFGIGTEGTCNAICTLDREPGAAGEPEPCPQLTATEKLELDAR